jgi:hypothetical protein
MPSLLSSSATALARMIRQRDCTSREIVDALVDADLGYDQLILEFERWVHISWADKPRHHALIIDRTGTRPLVA